MTTGMSLPKADSDVEFLRALAEQALRSIDYDENSLARAHKTVAVIKAVIAKGFSHLDLSDIDADSEDADDFVDRDNAETPEEFIRACWANALGEVKYHEQSLRDSHVKLAIVVAIIKRGNYDIDSNALRVKLREERETKKAHA